jgi:AcrR family transcriptional regulator
LFAEKGFAGTTVRDIADSVGILSGSLYHHFYGKEEIAEELFAAYFDELTARWSAIIEEDSDTCTKFEAMLHEAIANVDRHTAAARLFTHEWHDLAHLSDFASRWNKIENMWLSLIRQGVREGVFRSDIDPTLLYSLTMDSVRGLSGWYHIGARYSIAEVSDAYVSVVMAGIAAGPAHTDGKRRTTKRPS